MRSRVYQYLRTFRWSSTPLFLRELYTVNLFFMDSSVNYQGFEHAASELSAYTSTVGVFIISMKNGSIVHYTPKDEEAFAQWLKDNKIRDIRTNDGVKKT